MKRLNANVRFPAGPPERRAAGAAGVYGGGVRVNSLPVFSWLEQVTVIHFQILLVFLWIQAVQQFTGELYMRNIGKQTPRGLVRPRPAPGSNVVLIIRIERSPGSRIYSSP